MLNLVDKLKGTRQIFMIETNLCFLFFKIIILSTEEIVPVDGLARKPYKTLLKIVLVSVTKGEMSDILHSIQKRENVLVILDARKVEIMTTKLIASS